MPYRDPAWWRDVAPAIAGGLIAALITVFLLLAAPRPWPPGHVVKGLFEAACAWIAGLIMAVWVGPLVAQLFHISGAEGLGGVKVIVGVVAWKAVPIIQDLAKGILSRRAETIR